MRPVTHEDVVRVARTLVGVAPKARAARLASILEQARFADAWRTRTGRGHPSLGNGSLADCADTPVGSEPMLWNADYLACLGLVLNQLSQRQQAHLDRRNRANLPQPPG